jgi:hypothetical protein
MPSDVLFGVKSISTGDVSLEKDFFETLKTYHLWNISIQTGILN